MRKALFASSMGIGALLWLNTAAAAGLDPYPTGTTGYDLSSPQCGVPGPAGHFGIAGVNAGYPFTYYNSCLASEYAAATRAGNASLYVNTGYDPTYTAIDGRHTTQECATKAQAVVGTPDQQAAWGVGCSEAQRDIAYATSQTAGSPAGWWLDVETANSWSSTDLSLNRYTIQGIVDTLRPQGRPIGVYSTSLQWSVITGGFRVQVDADWVATGQRNLKRARAACSTQGFTGAPIWLVQYVTTVDNDYAC